MRLVVWLSTAIVALLVSSFACHAQAANPFLRDIETKYIFGFTEGSGIGLEGEKEFSLDTEARMGKQGGRYWASETKGEFEFTPNQYVQFEFGPFMSAHSRLLRRGPLSAARPHAVQSAGHHTLS